MAEYRTIRMAFWNDPFVEDLEAGEKLLYLYLFTCPHTSNLGVMEVSRRKIAFETGLDMTAIDTGLAKLEAAGKIVTDGAFILLLRFIRHQTTTSPKITQALKGMLPGVRSDRLRQALCRAYPDIFGMGAAAARPMSDRPAPGDTPADGMDTVAEGYGYPMDRVSIPYPYPIHTVGIPPAEEEEEREKEREYIPLPKDIFKYQNTRVRVDPPAEVCGTAAAPDVPSRQNSVEPRTCPAVRPSGRRPDGPVKTDAPSKGHPEWRAFLSCWELWPVKQGQEEAWCEWMRLHANGTLAPCYVIREAIARLLAEDSRWARGMVPRMAKWLHGKGWNDEPFIQPEQGMGHGMVNTDRAPRAPTEFQQRQQDSRKLAKALLEAREAERTQMGGHHGHADRQALADHAPCGM
ncbi:MAG: hypothetical protein ACLVI5_08700 [Desulfovibrio piger]|uniref:hypothetical protein n=1 Tax=Desulfovibrio piger TaxID=901 RepID=UPI0039996F09